MMFCLFAIGQQLLFRFGAVMICVPCELVLKGHERPAVLDYGASEGCLSIHTQSLAAASTAAGP
jgi:hypothetical protein